MYLRERKHVHKQGRGRGGGRSDSSCAGAPAGLDPGRAHALSPSSRLWPREHCARASCARTRMLLPVTAGHPAAWRPPPWTPSGHRDWAWPASPPPGSCPRHCLRPRILLINVLCRRAEGPVSRDSGFSKLPAHRARPGSVGQRVPNPGPGWAGGGAVHTRLADCVCAHGHVDCSGSCSSRELRGPPPSTSLPSRGAGSHTGPAQEPQVRGGRRASGVGRFKPPVVWPRGDRRADTEATSGPQARSAAWPEGPSAQAPGGPMAGHGPRCQEGRPACVPKGQSSSRGPPLRARPGRGKGPGGRRRRRKCDQGRCPPLADRAPRTSRQGRPPSPGFTAPVTRGLRAAFLTPYYFSDPKPVVRSLSYVLRLSLQRS